jgi:D-inositol-3-phosphate glycosyltransferase
VISSVAYLSMHTSPLLQPGRGSAGGMNVYIDELAQTMARRGIEVVVFTRRTDPSRPTVVFPRPGYRVVHVTAGAPAELPMAMMPGLVPEFTEGVLDWMARNEVSFDLVHSHYWLSGWSGVLIKEALDIPLANSFHTLGRIKDLARRPDEAPSSRMRTLTEEEVIARSDCVIASTPYEFEDLMQHYGATPERLCTSPPGLDHRTFRPGDRDEARQWLGLGPEPIILFAGRIQPLKGPDIAVAALAQVELVNAPAPHLLIVGGPSGPDGDAELLRVRQAATGFGIGDRVHCLAPQPHAQLAAFYQAADVLIMPSRAESFGLVAAEAQACGLPVVAGAVGGLPYVVMDGVSGLLVEGTDPASYAGALTKILGDPAFAGDLSAGAVEFATQFSWQATADRLAELYAGITGL